MLSVEGVISVAAKPRYNVLSVRVSDFNCGESASLSVDASIVCMCCDLAAHGSNVVGAVLGSDQPYGMRNGSSIAAALAAGVAAQMRESEPAFTAAETKQRMLEIADIDRLKSPRRNDAYDYPAEVTSGSVREAWTFSNEEDYCLEFTVASGERAKWEIVDGPSVMLTKGRGWFTDGKWFVYAESLRTFRVEVVRHESAHTLCVMHGGIIDASVAFACDDFLLDGDAHRTMLTLSNFHSVQRCKRRIANEDHMLLWSNNVPNTVAEANDRTVVACEKFHTAAECPISDCQWMGPVVGCTAPGYCSYGHPNACKVARGCAWTGGTCHAEGAGETHMRRALSAVEATTRSESAPRTKPKHHRVHYRRPPPWFPPHNV
jgi:hypothetical protein